MHADSVPCPSLCLPPGTCRFANREIKALGRERRRVLTRFSGRKIPELFWSSSCQRDACLSREEGAGCRLGRGGSRGEVAE